MADVDAADSVAVRISSSFCGNGSVDGPVPFALEPIGGSAASPSLIASLPLSSPSDVGSAMASSLLGELKGAVSSLSSTAEASMSPRTEGLSTSSTTAVEVGGRGEAGVAEGGVTLPICIDGLSACLLLVVESFDGRRSRDRSLSGEVGTKFPCRLWPFFLRRLGFPAASGVGSPELGTKIRRPHSCRCSDDVDARNEAALE